MVEMLGVDDESVGFSSIFYGLPTPQPTAVYIYDINIYIYTGRDVVFVCIDCWAQSMGSI